MDKRTHKMIGMMYDESNAMAQSAKIACAAIGLARSSNPGRILEKVVNHTARSGVFVQGVTCPK